MALTRIHYPHAINFAAGTDITQLDSLSFNRNDTILQEKCASGFAPEFLGIQMAAPEFSFSTQQVGHVLAKCTDQNIVGNFSAGNVDLEYRGGTAFSTRDALPGSTAVIGRILQSGMLYWTGLTATQGEVATIDATFALVHTTGTDPFTWLSGQAAGVTTCDVQELYSLGPVGIDTGGGLAALTGVTSVTWSNNVSLVQVASDGDPYYTFTCVGEIKPEIKIRTNDLTLMDSIGDRGAALTEFQVHLRAYKEYDILDDKATAVHIKLSGTAGYIVADSPSGSPTECELTIYTKLHGAPQVCFSVATSTAILL